MRAFAWVGIALLLAGGCAKNEPTGTDTTPPAAVNDLAIGAVTATTVELSWTASGDDGATGTAQSYDIRFSTNPINSGNFDNARELSGEPAPQPAGSAQSFTATGLNPLTHYYFALVTRDDDGNLSAVSNVPDTTTSRRLRRWTVDDSGGKDFRVILEALDAAANDDTVFVYPGDYQDSLRVRGKRLVLVGANADSAVVHALTGSLPVLRVSDGADLEVRDLRFIQGTIPCGAGVELSDARLVMQGCVLWRCGLGSANGELTLRQCTLWEAPLMTCDRIVPLLELIAGGSALIEQNIIGSAGTGVGCSGDTQVTFHCNDAFPNRINYSGCPDPTGTNGNISADPKFMGAGDGNFHLQGSSPCGDGMTPGCGRMGALD